MNNNLDQFIITCENNIIDVADEGFLSKFFKGNRPSEDEINKYLSKSPAELAKLLVHSMHGIADIRSQSVVKNRDVAIELMLKSASKECQVFDVGGVKVFYKVIKDRPIEDNTLCIWGIIKGYDSKVHCIETSIKELAKDFAKEDLKKKK